MTPSDPCICVSPFVYFAYDAYMTFKEFFIKPKSDIGQFWVEPFGAINVAKVKRGGPDILEQLYQKYYKD